MQQRKLDTIGKKKKCQDRIITTEAAGEFGHCREEEASVTVHRGPAAEAGQYWEEASGPNYNY